MEIESGLHLPSFSFLYPRSCFGSSFSLPAVRIDGVSLYSQTLSTNEIHISFGCPRHTAAAEAGTRLGGAVVTDHTNTNNNNNSDANMMIGIISGGSSASSINSERSQSMMYGAAIRPAPLSYWSGYDGHMLAGFSWPPPSYTCNFYRREFRSAQALGGHMNVQRRDRARLRDRSPPLSNHRREASTRTGSTKNAKNMALLD